MPYALDDHKPKGLNGCLAWSLNIQQDAQQMWTMASKPDLDWVWVCGCDREHRWRRDGRGVTGCRREVRTYWCQDCMDDHDEVIYGCTSCDARIYPEFLMTQEQISVSAPREVTGQLEFANRLPRAVFSNSGRAFRVERFVPGFAGRALATAVGPALGDKVVVDFTMLEPLIRTA